MVVRAAPLSVDEETVGSSIVTGGPGTVGGPGLEEVPPYFGEPRVDAHDDAYREPAWQVKERATRR